MKKIYVAFLSASAAALAAAPLALADGSVLIVADEFPAMEVLAAKIKASDNIDAKLVKLGLIQFLLGNCGIGRQDMSPPRSSVTNGLQK